MIHYTPQLQVYTALDVQLRPGVGASLIRKFGRPPSHFIISVYFYWLEKDGEKFWRKVCSSCSLADEQPCSLIQKKKICKSLFSFQNSQTSLPHPL